MRWDNLFDDLEGQLEQGLTSDEFDLRAEEERLRLSRLSLRDRLVILSERAEPGPIRTVRLLLRDGSRIVVTPDSFGRDWFAGELHGDGTVVPQCVVPLEAIAGLLLSRIQVEVSLDPSRPTDVSPPLSARLGLGFVLRDLCRRRLAVDLRLEAGQVHGTLDRVGRDHFDVAVHEPGQFRRESNVTEYRVVPLRHLLLVSI